MKVEVEVQQVPALRLRAPLLHKRRLPILRLLLLSLQQLPPLMRQSKPTRPQLSPARQLHRRVARNRHPAILTPLLEDPALQVPLSLLVWPHPAAHTTRSKVATLVTLLRPSSAPLSQLFSN